MLTRFADVVDALSPEPGVAPPDGRPRFGGSALTVDGSIFAMLVKDDYVVKLPAARVTELVDSDAGAPFVNGSGRPMREWVVVRDGDWTALAREALAFVRSAQRG